MRYVLRKAGPKSALFPELLNVHICDDAALLFTDPCVMDTLITTPEGIEMRQVELHAARGPIAGLALTIIEGC
jgi:hypothetical protein